MMYYVATFIDDEDGHLYRCIVKIDTTLYTNVEHARNEWGTVGFSIDEMTALMRCNKVPKFRSGSHYVFITEEIVKALELTHFDTMYSKLDRDHKARVTEVLQGTLSAGHIVADPIKRLSSEDDLVPPVIVEIRKIQKQLGLSDMTMLYIAKDILGFEDLVHLDNSYMLLDHAKQILAYMECCAK